MQRVFAALICAALLFAARVNNSSADNPFPWRSLFVHVGLCYWNIRADYASQYTHNMANIQLKWLFPRVLRAGKRANKASSSYFRPRGQYSARQSAPMETWAILIVWIIFFFKISACSVRVPRRQNRRRIRSKTRYIESGVYVNTTWQKLPNGKCDYSSKYEDGIWTQSL